MAGIPIEWTFWGEVDWDAITTANVPDLEYLFKPVFEAVKERCAASGATVPALISATYNPIRPLKDYTDAVQGIVTTLIPLYIDHTDNGGNWDGQTSIPAWSEATILAHCTDTIRITVNRLDVLRQWFRQQYQMLNLMRWRKINSNSISATDKKLGTTRDSENATASDAWGIASLSYDGCAWAGGNTSILPFGWPISLSSYNTFANSYVGSSSMSQKYSAVPPYYFHAALYNAKSAMTLNCSIGIPASLDLYVIPVQFNIFSDGGSWDGQFDNSSALQENVLNKIWSAAETDVSSPVNTATIELGKPPRCADATIAQITGGKVSSCGFTGGVFILKFTGAGGFRFKD